MRGEMFRLIGIVVSIGLADSLNPSTVAPALYMATGQDARRSVTQFTLAVFVVYLFGGLVLVAGPGALLLSLVPTPDYTTRKVLEVIAGGVLIVAGLLLWRHRIALGEKRLPEVKASGRTAWILGATITAAELPTAFPYFAAVAAIVGSGYGFGHQLILLLLFNGAFVLPLVAIVATLWLAGDTAEVQLARARDGLQRNWPPILAGVAVVAGGIAIAIGATGTYHAVSQLG
jgi:cytochrome c biogenesis protein CcdA